MKMNFLEPVERGSLVAEARVLRSGRHFSMLDCDVTGLAGRLCATALLPFAYSMPEAAGGSREAQTSVRASRGDNPKDERSLTGR